MPQKRKAYTVGEKLKIIDRVKSGETKANLSRVYGVPEGTIRGWMKEEDKLRNFVNTVESEIGLQRKKNKLGQNSDLDECLYRWFLIKRSEGVPLSGPVIRAQAVKFYKDLHGSDDFNASDGWFSRWKSRHGIGQINIEGEARSCDSESAECFPRELKQFMTENNLNDHQVYNCDETALYYRLLPSKTLDVKNGVNKSGIKMNKDRVTLLFTVNKSGSHKLKPLCIGKSRSPRCFKHVNMNSLPYLYRHSKNAWMTSDIFTKWFHEEFVPSVRKHLRSLKIEERAVLTLDHCPAHPPADILQSRDGNIRVMFLPKNTTALIQPLDQGIIRAFKAHYRRELLSALVNSDEEMENFLKSINLKSVAYSVGLAWESITQDTIQNCWKKCSRDETVTTENCSVAEFTNSEVQSASNVLHSKITIDDLNDWVDIDNSEEISEHTSDEDIINAVHNKNDNEKEDDGEDDGGVNDVEAEENIPNANEVISHLNNVILWMERQNDSNSIHLLHLAAIKQYAENKRSASVRQTKLTDFFKRNKN